MIVRFWGVRGSYPVPGSRTVRYGGNTACVEVQAGAHTIILDAGTGIINLGLELLRRARANGNKPVVATLFFSHMHHDHTQGFPFFRPAYVGASTLHILGPKVFQSDLEETLSHAMLPPSFPGRAPPTLEQLRQCRRWRHGAAASEPACNGARRGGEDAG